GLADRHEVSLLSFLESEQSTSEILGGPLSVLCPDVSLVPAPHRSRWKRLGQLLATSAPDMAHRLASEDFAARLSVLLRGQDESSAPVEIVQVEGLELAHYMQTIRQHLPSARIVFDNHNAETELQWRSLLADLKEPGRWPVALYSWLQVARLRRYERWACREADAVVAVSGADRRHLVDLDATLDPTVIPNAIDTVQIQRELHEEAPATIPDQMLFVGKMDYRPNVDAALWFGRRIWPQIKERRPKASWLLVGQRPHRRLDPLRRLDGVHITGRVESVGPYLKQAQVMVMPFRVGSGTRLKLVQALAARLPVVSTTVGAEGYPVETGRHLLLADDPDRFAEAVITLLEDSTLRERMGMAGAQLAARYDWRRVVPQFDRVYREVVAKT
ncbi:MAG: glycosyltransferase family 4 protein, partial [Candidatus Promineifilaceae bacterium]|nr:glycosyltransferase family 4 protein [Candidatus Promineifilaceae bacterium]